MIDTLILELRFHGPFHVLTGSAGKGIDDTVDESNPLPESEVKGLMRASATRLEVPPGLLAEVFGVRAQDSRTDGGSPWAWSCHPPEHVQTRVRTSVPIDPATGTSRAGAIRFADELWATTMRVEVERMGWVPAERIDTHLRVLRASARGVNAVGSDRNRGYGWVTVTEVDTDPFTKANAHELAEWLHGLGKDDHRA